ncbi:hypothetical protein F3087_17340 [Nocardia colli]|uniref:Secreted protein n=1 Tax=Nocardia colli TaxID=2545717 RepID=A0A5N0EDD7_9NOCA|nr:hypothetical protein [Nocardia colli]KAA8887457.1 hypothetical protein F3087_17340 [Nocardia colli]
MSITHRVVFALTVVSAAVIIQANSAVAAPAPLIDPSGPISAPPVALEAHSTPLLPDPYVDGAKPLVIPHGVEGRQQHFTPSPEQWDNARVIVEVVRRRGLPVYAAVVSLATALQESTLRNFTVAVDHDSLGLFQQRPSAGWGAPEQVTDPWYATGKFLDALLFRAPDYLDRPLWQAAQDAQRSAFPTLYAQWQEQAAQMALWILRETANSRTVRIQAQPVR